MIEQWWKMNDTYMIDEDQWLMIDDTTMMKDEWFIIGPVRNKKRKKEKLSRRTKICVRMKNGLFTRSLTVTICSTQNCFVFFRTNAWWPKIRHSFRKGRYREPEPWPIITSLPVRRFLRGFDYLVFDVLEHVAGLLGFMCHFCFYSRGGHKDLAGSTPIPGQNSTSADTCR